MIVAGTTSTGGLTAFAVMKLRAKKDARTIHQQPEPPSNSKGESS